MTTNAHQPAMLFFWDNLAYKDLDLPQEWPKKTGNNSNLIRVNASCLSTLLYLRLSAAKKQLDPGQI